MSDVIKLLPDSVANQIAAGEVIQRPASVVKELVENAVDAGATRITLIVKDAGRTLIQVVDDGCGMSEMDARMAFERHSTSKITVANDLFSLHTMGFRGEALASICAVAQVELKTMRHDDTIGTEIVISGSRVESQRPVATAPGTNMAVKNLFFNVPARRKFLKKDTVEFSNIMHEFERLALVNPGLDLTIIHNDVTLHQLLRGSLKQRISGLFGKAMEKQLLPIGTTTSVVTINGFVGLPENARRRGALQYFFVNGRNMRHPYFHKAVMHCYEKLIRADEQPNYFINFEVDPSTIDVNIHPTKNEIKFENEQPIWQILTAAIRESLGKFNVVPAIDFDAPATDIPELPPFRAGGNAPTSFDISTDYNPFEQSTHTSVTTPSRTNSGGASSASRINTFQHSGKPNLDNWEQLYERFTCGGAPVDTDTPPTTGETVASKTNAPEPPQPADSEAMTFDDIAQPSDSSSPTIMQLRSKYLLTQSRGGLMIIDQHRAHVRVLYEEYMAAIGKAPLPSQQVMFPDMVQLSASQSALLENYKEETERLGYELGYLGDNTWSINGTPTATLNISHQEFLAQLLDDIADGTDTAASAIRSRMALALARAAAIQSGRTLTAAEMENLVSRLFMIPNPGYTPDGLRIIAELSDADLAKLFA